MTKKGAVISSTDPQIVTKIRSLNPRRTGTGAPNFETDLDPQHMGVNGIFSSPMISVIPHV